MSKTVVQIIEDGTYRAAMPFQVLIVQGDTIEFSAPDGGGTVLSLTPEIAGILSPAPGSLLVEIAGGSACSFEFLKPAALSYCCQLLAEGAEPKDFNCPPPTDDVILTILSSKDRGPDNKTGRGI